MASNERENARKEKKRKAQRRTKIILWAIILAIAVALVVMKIAELDFAAVKSRYIDKEGNVSVTASAAYPYSLDSSKNVRMVTENDKLCILTSVSVTVLNPTNGTQLYSFNHGYANPIMDTAGNYVCLFDQGAYRLRLDTLSGAVYETKTDLPILTAAVSRSGDVIYASRSSDNKSTVFVLDSKLKKRMELEVNEGYVVSAAIDPSGKRCAYAVINTENAVLKTTVFTVNVGSSEPVASFDFSGTELLDMHYCRSDMYLVCADGVYTVSSQKKLQQAIGTEEQGVNTVCYTYTPNDEMLYVYSGYSAANENCLVHINSSGKEKLSLDLVQKPKAVSAASNEITVLFPDSVAVYSLTRGEEKGTYACDDSVSSAVKLSSKVFVCRHQLIDIIE
ncbi:MAG: hypothetical protein IJ168_07635 [Eubacterium sp.]|nr:hypothetical protein [Eubacterium sp.]